MVLLITGGALVLIGVVVWGVLAVREMRRVLDQEGNLLSTWEDTQ